MSRPAIRIVKLASKCRYGLLAATLLSTPALPHWSVASEALDASDGTIVLAQREDPKKKKEQPQKGQPRGKQPPQHNAQPQHKQTPKQPPQQRAQPQHQQAPKQPPQQRAQPQHKEAPRQQPQQRSVQPQQRPAPQQPQQRSVQPQQRPAQQQQRSVQPQHKEAPQQQPQQRSVQPQQRPAPQQRSVQPQQTPQQRGIQPQQPPQQRSVQPQQRPAPNQPQQQQNAQPQQRRAPNQPPQQQQNAQPQFNRGPQNAQQNRALPQGVRNVEQLRSLRQQRTGPNGRVVIEEPDHRRIVREQGHIFIRHDDRERFRRWGNFHEERRGNETYTIVRRPDGTEIITVNDANGRLLRRIRRGRDHREIVLIDNRRHGGAGAVAAAGVAGFFLGLAAPRITIPRDRYIVDVQDAPPALIYQTLEAPPLVPIERPYSLDEIRYNVELRDRMRRVDIDTIHFESGSWEVASDQYPALQEIANAILRVIQQNPSAVFMIEGYTDAVGQDVDNLSLSDRRAETVAEILSANFNVPPENLVTQGYGEQYLKIPTQGPNRENRRVTVRNITPLLKGASR